MSDDGKQVIPTAEMPTDEKKSKPKREASAQKKSAGAANLAKARAAKAAKAVKTQLEFEKKRLEHARQSQPEDDENVEEVSEPVREPVEVKEGKSEGKKEMVSDSRVGRNGVGTGEEGSEA